MMACAMGCNPPPPAPWMARATSSIGRLVAIPQKTELSVKTDRQIRKYRLRPSALTIQPAAGSIIALQTR